MNDLERLIAIEEIKQLKARYLLYVDTKKWQELEALFASDASMDTEESGVRRDLPTFIARVSKLLASAVTVHHGGMPIIRLHSATTASGIWAMQDRLWFPASVEGSAPRYWEGAGHYHETYTRIDGQWRIQTLQLTRLHLRSK